LDPSYPFFGAEEKRTKCLESFVVVSGYKEIMMSPVSKTYKDCQGASEDSHTSHTH
jgi:hypothetical protein